VSLPRPAAVSASPRRTPHRAEWFHWLLTGLVSAAFAGSGVALAAVGGIVLVLALVVLPLLMKRYLERRQPA